MTEEIFNKINDQITVNQIVLYMKGTPGAPRCGFSATVVNILLNIGVKFKSFDVLEDDNLREAIKKYSDWPTIPQLYIKGEFIGGCDIVKELYNNGELVKLTDFN